METGSGGSSIAAVSGTGVTTALAWLDAEWRKPTRLSTVPRALVAMGLDEADALRWLITVRLAVTSGSACSALNRSRIALAGQNGRDIQHHCAIDYVVLAKNT